MESAVSGSMRTKLPDLSAGDMPEPETGLKGRLLHIESIPMIQKQKVIIITAMRFIIYLKYEYNSIQEIMQVLQYYLVNTWRYAGIIQANMPSMRIILDRHKAIS